ncbi:MAG TPA: hypothetical protein VMW35_04925 [Myxococcota bacterium]|nr:hypothetical protein [Myxococcota bacterium]
MRRLHLPAVAAALMFAGFVRAQQYPLLDMVADEVIQKYGQASCEQLWEHKGAPKSERAQELIKLLHEDPQMRQRFFDKVAGPIASKMFECGMIP